MAGLSFMESFALGYMAAGSGPDWGATLSGIQTDYSYKQALAQADADYTALVNEYNRLVDGFNELYRIGSRLEAQVASQNERIARLEQVIADANRRADAAEKRAADAEARDAEAQRDAAALQERYRGARNLLAAHASELDEARAENTRLEAIIAGMNRPPEQDAPSPDTPIS
jgi:chromosome segregation ATPase